MLFFGWMHVLFWWMFPVLLRREYIFLLVDGVSYTFSLGLITGIQSLFYILLISLRQNLQTSPLMLRKVKVGTIASFSLSNTFTLGAENLVHGKAAATGLLGLSLSVWNLHHKIWARVVRIPVYLAVPYPRYSFYPMSKDWEEKGSAYLWIVVVTWNLASAIGS